MMLKDFSLIPHLVNASVSAIAVQAVLVAAPGARAIGLPSATGSETAILSASKITNLDFIL